MDGGGTHVYALALGSNRGRAGMRPADIVRAALDELDRWPLSLIDASPVMASAPVGPSQRRYANGAALVETDLSPPALLAHLKKLERDYGRRRGRRWGARPLDIDIILWSGGLWSDPRLAIPHVGFRERDFVLTPLVRIAGDWRDPVRHLTVRHLHARNKMRKPVDPVAKAL